ncbi:MAG: hypothetical protein DWQ19_09640 [Crenarchaeota archaeon]|nr:MAG: hypothetical protein DWQ19_09640 [Thermoproteota archaeon]
MKHFLQKVTLTGADDNVDPNELLNLSLKFPFVEWGILFSPKEEGTPRYPSRKWLKSLHEVWKWSPSPSPLDFSGHICGKWVRDICEGNWSILEDHREIINMFGRFQLNFHSLAAKLHQNEFIEGLKNPTFDKVQFIFQLDDINHELVAAAKEAGVDAVPMFDISGGRGRLPSLWPKGKGYCGYAGGLSPANLEVQLNLISQVTDEAWIDVESHIRSNDEFDLEKVHKFLEISSEWTINVP